MKKNIATVFLLSIGLILTAFTSYLHATLDFNKIAVYPGYIQSSIGPEGEIAILRNFPRALYKVYTVEKIGSFYIDSRSDMIKNDIRSGKIWEIEIVELLRKHVRPGSTAIDIGAHIGTHTMTMSKIVGQQGQVFAFEPQLKLFCELAMNMELNSCHNVTAYRAAVGDAFKTIEMSPAVAGNEGATSIGNGGDAAEMVPLDSLHLENVSFMKIDVENYEYEVLLGAQETICKNHPVMIIEIMGNTLSPIPDRNDRVHRTLNYVQQLGYTLTYIQGSWSDWIAIPNQ